MGTWRITHPAPAPQNWVNFGAIYQPEPWVEEYTADDAAVIGGAVVFTDAAGQTLRILPVGSVLDISYAGDTDPPPAEAADRNT